MKITEEIVGALEILRNTAQYDTPTRTEIRWAIATLDNADVFSEIDRAVFDQQDDRRISVTVREVPGGWIACQDNDRSKVVAEAVVYDNLEQRLRALDVPVHVEAILSADEQDARSDLRQSVTEAVRQAAADRKAPAHAVRLNGVDGVAFDCSACSFGTGIYEAGDGTAENVILAHIAKKHPQEGAS